MGFVRQNILLFELHIEKGTQIHLFDILCAKSLITMINKPKNKKKEIKWEDIKQEVFVAFGKRDVLT